MKSNLITVTVLLASAASAAFATTYGERGGESLNWQVAETSGMKVDYPAGIFTVDDGPTEKGKGRLLRSRNGTAGFMFYAEPNPNHDTPFTFYRSKLAAPNVKIDYTRITDRFCRGVRGAGWTYLLQSMQLPTRANGRIHCIELVYNETEKRFWDPIVTRTSLSLR
jgi:hypothetical protein